MASGDQELRGRLAELRAEMERVDADRDRVRRDRDKAIRQAHRAGMTAREIARVSGVSHQRVHQIVSRAR